MNFISCYAPPFIHSKAMNGLTLIKSSIFSCIVLGFLVYSKEWVSSTAHHSEPEQSDVVHESPTYTICTYFVTVGNSEEQDSENRDMLAVWQESWEKQGWTTKILIEKDAELHPRYQELIATLPNLPTVFSKDLSRACYLRWFAAVASECTVRTRIFASRFRSFVLTCLPCFTVDVRL